jgi:hypothetical protein
MFSIAVYGPDYHHKLAKAANLLEILSWYCSPNFHLIHLAAQVSVHTKLMCCLFTYQQSLTNFCNHQSLISSTISSQKDWMSGVNECHLLLSTINLILSLPIGRVTGVLWIFLCRYILFVTTKLFDVAKFPTLTPLSLLCSRTLSFPIASLETSSLPSFVLKSLKNFHMVHRKVMEYLF